MRRRAGAARRGAEQTWSPGIPPWVQGGILSRVVRYKTVRGGVDMDGPAPLRLSVLDQSPIAEGSTGGDALRNSIDLARWTDGLGYHRYWVAEHHGTPMLACASPEVLIGPIAAATSRLRVGSGGIMLPHYSPFKVAEAFSMLSGLFPGRIDLAV